MASDAVDDRPDTPADVGPWVERIASTSGPTLVIVDDADRVAGLSFERLGSLRRRDCAVVVAGIAEDLVVPGQWSRPLQPFRGGVLIGPTQHDTDLLHLPLGSPLQRTVPGAGIVVNDGSAEEVLLVSVGGDDESADGPAAGGFDVTQRSES